MKILAALLISTVSATACPFVVGTKVVTTDGHKGTVTEAFSSAADAVESATVKFEDGTEREYTEQPGTEAEIQEMIRLDPNSPSKEFVGDRLRELFERCPIAASD